MGWEAQKKLDEWLGEAKKLHVAAVRLAKIEAASIGDEEKKILKEQADSEAGKKLAKKFEKTLTPGEDD